MIISALALAVMSGSCGVKGPPANPTGFWGPEGTPAAINADSPSATTDIPAPVIDSP
ncbi:MAG: hypothetical protein GXP52_03470 [Deltaproteobacteria bacterium]|nr:hypothetical protein [Deltaproteobacteria bacterium]